MEINQAHLHLMLNHVPVLGSVVALLLLGSGLLGKSRALLTAGLVAMLVVGVVTIPVFISGEPAEEVVEHQPHVSESAIHEHEEMAESARWAALAGGLFALLALLLGRDRDRYPGWTGITGALLSLATVVLMALTANLGGKVAHPELRGDGLLPFGNGRSQPASPGRRHEEHDDDD